jgi:hypothetical protein
MKRRTTRVYQVRFYNSDDTVRWGAAVMAPNKELALVFAGRLYQYDFPSAPMIWSCKVWRAE